jgi:flavin reductase (DIM6/NTAB) family NADH-FMN oxidoreductase RutF
MNAAWGGISEEKEISICVSAGHKTMKNILKSKAFTVSMGTAEYLAACDYVGIVSGNDVPDKFVRAGFHATKSEFVNAPLIDELPVAVECKFISYDEETCRLVGEIVNVCADENMLNAEGKVDPAKLRSIIFDPMNLAYLLRAKKWAMRSKMAKS